MNIFKMRYMLLLAALSLGVAAHYEGFKLYQLTISNDKQLAIIEKLSQNVNYDFWSEVGPAVDVMVRPLNQTSFESLMRDNDIIFAIIIDDVERIVQQERIAQNRAFRAPKGQITFTKYHRYEEIQNYLKGLQEKHSDIVKLFSAGKSFEGRDITVIRISTDIAANKPAIFIDGGIHAREWISPATVLYIIKELVENEKNKYLLDRADWHIVPLLNPDGYEYTHTDERFWRKNRAINAGSNCIGTDLNRNFGYHWGESGASPEPCHETYKGAAAFSEPESKSVEKYILKIQNNIKLYLTFHSFGQYILHPWGYGNELPEDAPKLKHLGDLAAKSIKAVFNTTYEVGSSTHLLGAAAGGSDDWAKGGANIKYSYTIELPGPGFDLPPSKILNTAIETFEGVKSFHDYIVIQ